MVIGGPVVSPFLAVQVKEQMKLLKHLYLAVSGLPSDEEEVQLPDDLTAEKMVTVVTAFFKASNDVIENVVKELLAKVTCASLLYGEFLCSRRPCLIVVALLAVTSLSWPEPTPCCFRYM